MSQTGRSCLYGLSRFLEPNQAKSTRFRDAPRSLFRRQLTQRFLRRLKQYRAARARNPDYLRQIWQEERGRLFEKMREGGRVDLLDHHLGQGGLDLFTAPAAPGKR